MLTEARNVRRRLARYYEEEGHGDPVRIQLPKGGYAPQFVEAPQTETEPVSIDPALIPETQNTLVATEPAAAGWKLGGLLGGGLSVWQERPRWWQSPHCGCMHHR